MTIKVRRAGIHRIFRKSPFRAWLDAQPRKLLTYDKLVPNKDGIGWTAEDFTMEAMKRGVHVRLNTAHTWSRGSKPRWISDHALRGAFKDIEF